MYLKNAVASECSRFTIPSYALFRLGLDGNACTLRLLCEVAERPLKNAGLLGDIINLVLRGDPSDGNRGGQGRKTDDYIGAQNLGKAGNCTSLYKHCPVSLFNFPMFNK